MKFDNPPTFQVTPFGDVDAKGLESLRASFDTTELLALVDQIDRLRHFFAVEGGLRDGVLRLHAMAHTVINGGPLTVAPTESDIWESAQDLVDDFQRVADIMQRAIACVQQIAALAPE